LIESQFIYNSLMQFSFWATLYIPYTSLIRMLSVSRTQTTDKLMDKAVDDN